MKNLGKTMLVAALAVAASPAFAQTTSNPTTPPAGPPYGYGPMWGYGHHMWGGWGWGFHPFASMLMVIVTVFVIIGLVRMFRHGAYYGHGHFRHGGFGRGTTALDILEERFAKGEIDKSEFEEKRKLLAR